MRFRDFYIYDIDNGNKQPLSGSGSAAATAVQGSASASASGVKIFKPGIGLEMTELTEESTKNMS